MGKLEWVNSKNSMLSPPVSASGSSTMYLLASGRLLCAPGSRAVAILPTSWGQAVAILPTSWGRMIEGVNQEQPPTLHAGAQLLGLSYRPLSSFISPRLRLLGLDTRLIGAWLIGFDTRILNRCWLLG